MFRTVNLSVDITWPTQTNPLKQQIACFKARLVFQCWNNTLKIIFNNKSLLERQPCHSHGTPCWPVNWTIYLWSPAQHPRESDLTLQQHSCLLPLASTHRARSASSLVSVQLPWQRNPRRAIWCYRRPTLPLLRFSCNDLTVRVKIMFFFSRLTLTRCRAALT